MIGRLKLLTVIIAGFLLQTPVKQVDPAAWGGNHVGNPLPEYVHGDECLFCHRNTIGATWQQNSHGLTVRHRADAPELEAVLKSQSALAKLDPEIEYFLGSRHRLRFLKKQGYGKFALLNVQATLGADHKAAAWDGIDKPAWQKEKFTDGCAGCHTTGVDSKDRTFSGFGLDCYTCHGVVDLNHSNDTSLVMLSKKWRSDAKVVTSVCAQCHLRGGKSRTVGLPYPNNFVAGDNLFQDFAIDFAAVDDPKLNPGDRHVLRNVRDVVLYGNEEVTCLNCHQVHANTSARHRRALRAPICFDCHNQEGPFKNTKPYTVHSAVCEY